MSENLQQRHDISDKTWAVLSPLLPGQPQAVGWNRQRQQEVHQWRILDTSDRSAMA